MSSEEKRCSLTELLERDCHHCRTPVAEAVPLVPVVPHFAPNFHRADKSGPWFPAGYGGECSECGSHFEENDVIQADGSGGWRARECCGGG
jgi:hypothetical protein